MQGSKEIYIFFGIGILLVIGIIILFFTNPQEQPIVPEPPIEEGVVYEDDRFVLIKIAPNKYEAEIKNIEVTEKEIRDKAKLTNNDELTILLRADLLPPLDAEESYQEEITQDIENQKLEQDEEFDPEEWGLNPIHKE